MACPPMFDCLLCDFITGDDVVAIDDVTWNAERRRFLRQVAHGCLHVRRRRIRVMVRLNDYDQWQALYRGKVHPFIEGAGARAAITDVSKSDDVFLLHARAQKYSSHHRNHVAEMRNWADEASVHIAEMHVEIFSTRWAPGLRHVLGKDFARPNSFNEHSAEIANDRRDEIIRPQSISRSDGGGFLAQ